jgi:hypothetical protein
VTVDTDGTLTYSRILVTTGRGVNDIDHTVLQIAFDHWITKLTKGDIAGDVSR